MEAVVFVVPVHGPVIYHLATVLDGTAHFSGHVVEQDDKIDIIATA